MQEEFLLILRSLKQNIEEINTPLEAAQLDFYGEDNEKVQNGKDFIMGELTMVVLMLTDVDQGVSKGELELLNDMRHMVYGYGIPELNSDDYFELMRKFLSIYPGSVFTLDHMPASVRVLKDYDEKKGTNYADKARSVFTQFANAMILADKEENYIETIVLENFKDFLNAG